MASSRRYIVLGAGITGLSLGWFLKKVAKKNDEIKIFEKASRPGGWIQSLYKEDFLFELGPHSCRAAAATAAWNLIEEVGLAPKILLPSPEAKKRFVLYKGALKPLPSTIKEACFSPFTPMLLKGLWHDFFASPSPKTEETVFDFFSSHLGGKVAKTLVDALVLGIYAGDPTKLSAAACFPNLWELDQKYGSLIKGFFKEKKKRCEGKKAETPFFTFAEGLELLPATLADRLPQELTMQAEVVKISFGKEAVAVTLATGDVYEADHLFSTLPAHVLANLLAPQLATAAASLAALPTASVASISLGWNHSFLPKGFGYLVPAEEKEPILGAIFSSKVFPQQNRRGSAQQTRVTVMVGGVRNPSVMTLSDQELNSLVHETLARHLHIEKKADVSHIFRAIKAIPQYEVGYLDMMKGIKDFLTKESNGRITLLGPSFGGGVGVADC